MPSFSLSKQNFIGGVWRGYLKASGGGDVAAPALEVTHEGNPQPGLSIRAAPGQTGAWIVEFEVPGNLIGDGITTFLFTEPGNLKPLDQFSVSSGGLDHDDIRAEIELLRAELDFLRSACRAHFSGHGADGSE